VSAGARLASLDIIVDSVNTATAIDRIEAEIASIPEDETSSRFFRARQFWSAEGLIEPGSRGGPSPPRSSRREEIPTG